MLHIHLFLKKHSNMNSIKKTKIQTIKHTHFIKICCSQNCHSNPRHCRTKNHHHPHLSTTATPLHPLSRNHHRRLYRRCRRFIPILPTTTVRSSKNMHLPSSFLSIERDLANGATLTVPEGGDLIGDRNLSMVTMAVEVEVEVELWRWWWGAVAEL
ncbi:hypothetical protein HanRHA438_Chr14g0634311 [Helianthus annuus]|nr:hypothetical protein HanIR_Chr14g0675961 [Helianthus annuus]KAJ0852097.1 hypothetical protein HanRHA438_Chr14g0634311 [Helianthus annuus]